ncbi:acetylcholine receptor subunit beta-type acr-2-like [Haliotis rubra]|uniref:acetylcholine receptor subunit beta-type acr-2-like n=1 Tax=Haliotis rubra TaxID=36100 RepID=UPI001EE5F9A4|nr:acetylcholine receptor subunit beta-type acr-2-like [Haliotis rubra]
MWINIILVILVVPYAVGQNTSSRLKHQLFRDTLLHGYPKDIPPFSSEDPYLVTVNVSFLLLYIQGLDVASQVLTVFGTLIFEWYDPLLIWNSSSHENPTYLKLESNEIWTPPFMFSNNAGSPLDSSNALIYGFGDGYVSMTITDLFHTQCFVDVTRYPFDKQQCSIFLNSLVGYTFNTTNVKSNPFTSILGKSVEWKVEDVSLRVEHLANVYGVEEVARIIFSLSREYTFHLLTVITPVSLLSVMNACAFLLPVESGEKISFLISILVTYAVFLNFVIDVLPKSGVPSRLAIYLILVFCQSCAVILTTLGLLNLYQGADDKKQSSTEATPVEMNPRDGLDLDILSAKVSPIEIETSKEKVPKTRGKKWIKSLERKLFLVFLAFALLSFIILFV